MATDTLETNLTHAIAKATRHAEQKAIKAHKATVASARDKIEAREAAARAILDTLAAEHVELVRRRMTELDANTQAQQDLYVRLANASSDFMRTARSLGKTFATASTDAQGALENSLSQLRAIADRERQTIEGSCEATGLSL